MKKIYDFKRQISRMLTAIILLLLIFTASFTGTEAEDTDFSSVYNPEYYADNNEDLLEAYGYNETLLFDHFIKVGMREGRRASEEFDVKSYKARYFDLRLLYGEKLELYYYHYIFYGKAEGRDGSYDENLSEKPFRRESIAYQKELSKVTLEDVKDYYDKAVFVGDSIMVGFQYYAGLTPAASVSSSEFLAAKSFAVVHAISSLEEDDHQPVFEGEKRNVWDHLVVLQEDDKVFLMFGTNDLLMATPDRTISRYDILMEKIRETRPDIDIYIISMTSAYPGTNKNYLNNRNIAYMNAVLEMQAPFKNYTYVDLNSYIADEKYDQKTELSSDNFVHQNMTSYKTLWEECFYNFAADEIARARMIKVRE